MNFPAILADNITSAHQAISLIGQLDTATYTARHTTFFGSTVRRELQFLLGHAIHHDALIAAICRSCDICPKKNFGMAPATLRHHASRSTTAATHP